MRDRATPSQSLGAATAAPAAPHAARLRGRWLLTLFALPFALGGWGVLLLDAVPIVHSWARAQAWQATPAQLMAAELVTHRGRGTTFSVNATYRYRVQGTEFTGSRVALRDGPDNPGTFQEVLGRSLVDALRSGSPVTA